LKAKPTDVFWRFDGQRRSTVWSCAGPRKRINPILAQILTLAEETGGREFGDAAPDADCGVPNGERLSSLWLCAGPEEMAQVIGVSAPSYQDYRLHRRNRGKAEVCGRRRGRRVRMDSHRSIPPRRTRLVGSDGTHERAILPPRGWKATSDESSVYSTRLPKISHAEI
jgi:hypothetical protein